MAYNSLNNWTGVGRLTADPELKQTNSGISVVSVTLAVDRSYADKDGTRQTDFIPCTAFRGNADFLAKWAHKGDVVGVTGTLQSRKYEDKEGKQRTSYDVIVNELSICSGRKPDGNQSRSENAEPIAAAEYDDNLPF